MRKLILAIVVLVSLSSCGTSKNFASNTKIIEGATVVQDKSFRSVSEWDYTVYFSDGSKRSATLSVALKKGLNPMVIAHNAVERLFKDKADKIVDLSVKPHSNKYGFLIVK